MDVKVCLSINRGTGSRADCKRGTAMGGRTEQHDEKIHNTNSAPRIFVMTKSRRMRWKDNKWPTNSASKSEGNRVTVKCRLKWEDDIKMILNRTA
jgi:hypothetical protein